MDMEFRHAGLALLRPESDGDTAGDNFLDWQGLRARLVAAHELRRTEARRAFAAASFAPNAAQTLRSYGIAQPVINPTGLINGKPGGCNDGEVAGALSRGDRG